METDGTCLMRGRKRQETERRSGEGAGGAAYISVCEGGSGLVRGKL